jgi:NodT family efflux transporter outer membrane factor (OMF) lipoprotein
MKTLPFLTTILGAVTCLGVLSSCLVGPDYSGAPAVDHSATFTGGGKRQGSAGLSHWWKTLDDPGLNAFVEQALAHNHDIGMAGQRLREARAMRQQASSALLPKAGVSAAFNRMNLGSFTGGGALGDTVGLGGVNSGFAGDSLDYWSSGLDFAWEIDVFGSARRKARGARARELVAAEALNGVRQALVAETTEAYFLIAGLRGQLATVKSQVALQQSQVEDMRERFKAGATSQLDLDRAQSRLELIREKEPGLEAGIVAQVKRLALLTGDRPDALDGQRVADITLPANLPMTRSGLPGELLRRRPDLRQRERELAEATEGVGLAVANFYPKFLIGATGPTAFATAPGDLFEASNYVWQFGPRIEWSIFSGGSNLALLEKANARQQAAVLEYQKAVLAAIGEVETELANLSAETRRLAIVQRALKASREASRRVRENHKAGASAFVEVLIEEEKLRDIEITEIRVKNQILQVWIRLHKALGGGWE